MKKLNHRVFEKAAELAIIELDVFYADDLYRGCCSCIIKSVEASEASYYYTDYFDDIYKKDAIKVNNHFWYFGECIKENAEQRVIALLFAAEMCK